MNLICVGDAMVDVVVKYLGDIQFNSDTPSSISIRSGGAAANTAVWAAKLCLLWFTAGWFIYVVLLLTTLPAISRVCVVVCFAAEVKEGTITDLYIKKR